MLDQILTAAIGFFAGIGGLATAVKLFGERIFGHLMDARIERLRASLQRELQEHQSTLDRETHRTNVAGGAVVTERLTAISDLTPLLIALRKALKRASIAPSPMPTAGAIIRENTRWLRSVHQDLVDAYTAYNRAVEDKVTVFSKEEHDLLERPGLEAWRLSLSLGQHVLDAIFKRHSNDFEHASAIVDATKEVSALVNEAQPAIEGAAEHVLGMFRTIKGLGEYGER